MPIDLKPPDSKVRAIISHTNQQGNPELIPRVRPRQKLNNYSKIYRTKQLCVVGCKGLKSYLKIT